MFCSSMNKNINNDNKLKRRKMYWFISTMISHDTYTCKWFFFLFFQFNATIRVWFMNNLGFIHSLLNRILTDLHNLLFLFWYFTLKVQLFNRFQKMKKETKNEITCFDNESNRIDEIFACLKHVCFTFDRWQKKIKKRFDKFLFLLKLLKIIEYQQCSTPDRRAGQCIDIHQCPYILSLLRPNLSAAERVFLQRSQCGYFGYIAVSTFRHKLKIEL